MTAEDNDSVLHGEEWSEETLSLMYGDKKNNNHAISRVCVDALFGQYDYELPAQDESSSDLSRLFIMYGENGTGKTTLLKLIYHALSPEENQGHRTFLARTKFNRLAIEFFDGTVFEADRKVRKGVGSLLLTLRRNGKTLAAVELELEKDLIVPATDKLNQAQRERLKELLKQLRDLNIQVYYVSDDRRHQGAIRSAGTDVESVIHRLERRDLQSLFQLKREIAGFISKERRDEDALSLQKAMHSVEVWVQHQVRQCATKGQGDVYSIYSKVISDIAHSPENRPENLEVEAKKLIKGLEALEETSRQYHLYGLTPPLPADDLVRSIRESTPTTLQVIYNVIKPHVDGIKARLTALQDIYNTINRFISTINSFYGNKEVSFNLDGGFTIMSEGKVRLHPSQLSSGEKQLFLLLCNTILARKHASLFLIDEPELSLNVVWQRKLVQAVLDNTQGSSVQFVLATHSLELITQHRSSVVRLIGKPRHHHPIQSVEGSQHGGEEE